MPFPLNPKAQSRYSRSEFFCEPDPKRGNNVLPPPSSRKEPPMPRAQRGAARRQSKNRWLKKLKGNRGARGNQWRKAKETVFRAGAFQYTHRKQVKREYRQLWITRISAACQQRGVSY